MPSVIKIVLFKKQNSNSFGVLFSKNYWNFFLIINAFFLGFSALPNWYKFRSIDCLPTVCRNNVSLLAPCFTSRKEKNTYDASKDVIFAWCTLLNALDLASTCVHEITTRIMCINYFCQIINYFHWSLCAQTHVVFKINHLYVASNTEWPVVHFWWFDEFLCVLCIKSSCKWRWLCSYYNLWFWWSLHQLQYIMCILHHQRWCTKVNGVETKTRLLVWWSITLITKKVVVFSSFCGFGFNTMNLCTLTELM